MGRFRHFLAVLIVRWVSLWGIRFDLKGVGLEDAELADELHFGID